MKSFAITTFALVLAPLATQAADTITATSINAAQASAIASALSSVASEYSSSYSSLTSSITDWPATITNSAVYQQTTSYSNIQVDFSDFRNMVNSAAELDDDAYEGLPTKYAELLEDYAEAEVSVVNKETEKNAASGVRTVGLWAAVMVGAGMALVLV